MTSLPSDDHESGHELADDDVYGTNPYSTRSHSEISLTETASTITWWRWPLIPIAAPIGAIVGSTLLAIMQWFGMKMVGGFHEDGWYYLYIMQLFTSGLFGWLWCYISSSLAPKGKTITGAVMATVLAMLGVFLTFLAFVQLEKTTGERVQLILACGATLIGSIIAVVQTHEEENP